MEIEQSKLLGCQQIQKAEKVHRMLGVSFKTPSPLIYQKKIEQSES